jgi:hypothetical protein
VRIHIQRIANPESYVVLLERVAEPCNKIMAENKRRRLAKQAAHDVRRQSSDGNAIAPATNELKGLLVRAGDFVHVMSQRGNYVDRVVLSSPVHCHTLIVVLFSEHALDRLLVDFTRTHFHIGRFLEPVKAIQVRLFKPKTFVIGQSDDDGVFMGGDEFERAVVIIMDSFVVRRGYDTDMPCC